MAKVTSIKVVGEELTLTFEGHLLSGQGLTLTSEQVLEFQMACAQIVAAREHRLQEETRRQELDRLAEEASRRKQRAEKQLEKELAAYSQKRLEVGPNAWELADRWARRDEVTIHWVSKEKPVVLQAQPVRDHWRWGTVPSSDEPPNFWVSPTYGELNLSLWLEHFTWPEALWVKSAKSRWHASIHKILCGGKTPKRIIEVMPLFNDGVRFPDGPICSRCRMHVLLLREERAHGP